MQLGVSGFSTLFEKLLVPHVNVTYLSFSQSSLHSRTDTATELTGLGWVQSLPQQIAASGTAPPEDVGLYGRSVTFVPDSLAIPAILMISALSQ